ncbi:MAG: hypothetical protein ACFFAS_08150 [Promethearchaeota archaeon]
MNKGNKKIEYIYVGKNEIKIDNRFILIQGKFQKDHHLQYKQMGKYDVIEEFNFIPIESFISIFKEIKRYYSDLSKSLELMELIELYNSSMNKNREIIVEYANLLKKCSVVVDLINILAKKELLLKEIELARIKEQSSDKSAKMDLLNKLSVSIKETQNQLDYLEEDYTRIKNQRNQIKHSIEEKNSQINDLNKKKKACFQKINTITRGMEENGGFSESKTSQHQSMAEQIKSLQYQAKDAQFKINKIKSNLKELNLKFEKIDDKFSKLDKDYQKLADNLKNDTLRVDELKHDLEKGMDKTNHSISIDMSKMNMVRNLPEIEKALELIENKLESLLKDNVFLKKGVIEDNFEKISKDVAIFQNKFTKGKKKAIIKVHQEQVMASIESLRIAESLIKDLQTLINNFLNEINLSCDFILVLKNITNDLWVDLQFARSSKEQIEFESLTTPEKIFFVISFYISLQIQLEYNTIIFSNLFIKNDYNKQGSIFRTIRKIIPIIENDEKLRKKKYVFILSNLKMKKQIDNVKIVVISENSE